MSLPPDDPEAAARERRFIWLLVGLVALIVVGGAAISLVYLLTTGGR